MMTVFISLIIITTIVGIIAITLANENKMMKMEISHLERELYNSKYKVLKLQRNLREYDKGGEINE